MEPRKRKRRTKTRKFNPLTANPNGYHAISRRCGLHIGHISRILNGKRNPSLATARRLAEKGMGITLDKLVSTIDRNRKRGVPAEISDKISAGVRAARARREDAKA